MVDHVTQDKTGAKAAPFAVDANAEEAGNFAGRMGIGTGDGNNRTDVEFGQVDEVSIK